MSRPINLSSFCYEFISVNNDDLNPKKFDIDYSVNLSNLEKYISSQTCAKTYYRFLLSFLKSIKYISCDEFVQIYNKNTD